MLFSESNNKNNRVVVTIAWNVVWFAVFVSTFLKFFTTVSFLTFVIL